MKPIIKNIKSSIRSLLFIAIAAITLIASPSCKELSHVQPPVNGEAPPALSNLRAESVPGGAKIFYDIPATDKDILYVKGEYTYKGEKRIVRSSVYNNFVLVEGLGDVEPVEVSLSLVDYSENVSSAEKITFTPLTPPIETIFASLQIRPDFGGVSITWNNETATEIGVIIATEDTLGVMRDDAARYSRDLNGAITFRGYDVKEYKFAVRIIDKWDNESDTKQAIITPLFEKQLDWSKFVAMELPGDNTTLNSNPRPFRLTFNGNRTDTWHTLEGAMMPFPMYETIDMGVEAKISRFKIFARPSYYYSNHTWRKFEIWGAKECPTGKPESYWRYSDEWKTGWELLGDYEIKRPSGNTDPSGNPGGEDTAYGQAGYDFEVPFDRENVRYLRFVVNTTWSMGGAMHMAEIEVYGDDGTR